MAIIAAIVPMVYPLHNHYVSIPNYYEPHQEEYPLRSNTATTSDWIGQVKGRVIQVKGRVVYAYDLGTISSGTIGSTAMPDNQNTVHKTVQKYKNRFKEAWEELSDK